MKKVIFLTFLTLLIGAQLIGQSVGINNQTPDNSAALDVKSTDKGVLIPRMNSSQRTLINSPATGLLVFDTDENSFWFYNGAEWIDLANSDKNVWLKKDTTISATLQDTAIYFVGNVSIGKDTSGAKLDIHSEENFGIRILQESKDAFVPVGLNIQMKDSSAHQQQGIRTSLNGTANSRIGHYITSNSNDSLTNLVAGSWSDLSYSSSITDSLTRQLIGSYNKVRGYDNIFLNGTRNDVGGTSYAILRGTRNEMNGTGDGEQIGTSNEFSSSSSTGIRIGTKNVMNGSGSGEQIGTNNKFTSNSSSGIRFGTKNELTGKMTIYGTYQNFSSTLSDSSIYALYNKMEGSSNDGNHFGLFNSLNTSGSGDRFGVENKLSGTGNGAQYGVSTSISTSGSGIHYGSDISLTGSGLGLHYGSKIVLSGSGAGKQYGHSIDISNTGAADHFGIQTTLSGAGNGEQFGSSNIITNTGTKAHYGTSNQLTGSGSGTQYGTHQMITVSGAGNQFGNYNAINGTGSGAMYATYNNVFSSGAGAHYGTYNRVTELGSGTHIAGYFEALGTGANKYAAIFNSGQVVANESGGDYDFRIESDNNQNMFFVDANTNRIGVGTNLPVAELDIRGAAAIRKNSSISNAHLEIIEEGSDFARINMTNDQESSFWTIAARPNQDSTLARFNFYSSQKGNVLSLEGDGDAVISNKLAIGTGAPLATLHANATADSDMLRIQNNGNTKFRLLSNNGAVMGANWDNAISNVFRVHMDHVFIGYDGNHVPEAKLEVDGAITIGNTSANVQAGSLRFNDVTNSFEGFDGTSWKAMVQKNDVQIGDLAYGGIVFWVDPTGQHGLVCAPTDQSIGVRWWAGSGGETQALGTGIYAGKMNTSIIISSSVAIGDDQLPYAAKICSELNTGGYGDWYLPSETELLLMYNNLHLAGLGGFANQYYWSSKEYSDIIAKGRWFSSGISTTSGKSNLARVRAIRSF